MTAFAMVASGGKQASVRRLFIALVATAIGVGALGAAQPYGDPTTTIELRVWQGIEDRTDIAVGARATDGTWGALRMVPLPLDDGFSPNGDYRYGQTTLEVPLTSAAPVGVEVRVWQAVRIPSLIYVSARGAGGLWALLGTVRLLLDDGIRSDLGFRYGDMRIEVELPEQHVVTLAGRAMQWGYVDGVGADARFGRSPLPLYMGLDVDADGNVIVANFFNPAIRQIAPDGTVTTIAGGTWGLRDGAGADAWFRGPNDVAVAPDGGIYVAELSNRRIRKVAPDGTVTTIAGTGPPDHEVSPNPTRDGPADRAQFGVIEHIALAPDGDLFIQDGPVIRRLSLSGWVSTFAGSVRGFADGSRERARFGHVKDMDVDASGNLYVLEVNWHVPGEVGGVATVRKISPGGVVRTIYRDRPAHRGGLLAHPRGIAVSTDGEIYISNTGRDQVVQLMPDGDLRAIAASGAAGRLDGAAFNFPAALAIAPSGALVVADQASSTVRAILPDDDGRFATVPLVEIEEVAVLEGVSVSVYAGRVGQSGLSGDGGPARSARFSRPNWMALDAAGNVILSDTWNHAIRRISADGTVTTLAGGNGEGMLDGPADRARFELPTYVALDGSGAIFVVESGAGRIRRIAPDGAVSTVDEGAMNSVHAIEPGPDGSLLISTQGEIWKRDPGGTTTLLGDGYGTVWGLGTDHEGSIFFINSGATNFSVRRLHDTGDVSTVFEDQRGRYGGLFGPVVHRLAIAPDGNLFVADPDYRQVVRIAPDGTTALVADHEAFGSASFKPGDILVTPEGDLLVSDAWQHVIWKITIDEDAGR